MSIIQYIALVSCFTSVTSDVVQ